MAGAGDVGGGHLRVAGERQGAAAQEQQEPPRRLRHRHVETAAAGRGPRSCSERPKQLGEVEEGLVERRGAGIRAGARRRAGQVAWGAGQGGGAAMGLVNPRAHAGEAAGCLLARPRRSGRGCQEWNGSRQGGMESGLLRCLPALCLSLYLRRGCSSALLCFSDPVCSAPPAPTGPVLSLQ